MAEPNPALESADVVSLGDEKQAIELVAQSILGLWEVVSNLTRLRPTRRERYRVTIFGSARTRPGHFVYEEVRRLAAELARMGCDIVTGGGPGLMQAANEGAMAGGDADRSRSVGIRVHLPFEQQVNAFVGQAYEHRTFFSRLHHFVLVSDAFVVVPGGIGTALELMMVWQLLQVRQLYHTPLILAGPMWAELVAWARQYMLRPDLSLADAQDIDLPDCVNTVEEVVALIRRDQAAWTARQGRPAPSGEKP